MDTLHGQNGVEEQDTYDYDAIDAPLSVSDNERRLHVRAYNHWTSLLGKRLLPSIEDLNPEELADFGPNSVLLDFSLGVENPAIVYIGSALREECGIDSHVERIADVHPRSLVSRLTDHYLQIIANAAPIGFEAEFTNQRDAEILYRGILMPFSSDDETIDFIYGVISWKEVASDAVSNAINAEIAGALQMPSPAPVAPMWADGPGAEPEPPEAYVESEGETAEIDDFGFDEATDISAFIEEATPVTDELDLGAYSSETEQSEELDLGKFEAESDELDLGNFEEEDDALDLESFAEEFDEPISNLPDLEAYKVMQDEAPAPASVVATTLAAVSSDSALPELSDVLDVREADLDLGDALDLARQSAVEARETDARSRAALYRAVGHAYDFALSARTAPEEYEAMLAKNNIVAQERSPMTAVVKLVFGADYEKTRLAEYATALEYAFAHSLPRGTLARQLAFYQGGLKGLVQDMRSARRDGEVKPSRRIERARHKLLRAQPIATSDLAVDADGLAVAIVRREADGSLSILGTIETEARAAQMVMIEAVRKR